jgi:hypothetical protein
LTFAAAAFHDVRAMKTIAAIALIAAAASPAFAATPPSGMMANVYRLTEAAAVVTVCRESESFRQLPPEKAAQFDDLAARLQAVVDAIGRHYKDEAMPATFEATRVKIAGETAMRGYVKTKYQYCGDGLLDDMKAYVVENEKLIGGYLSRQSLAPPPKPPKPAAKP